MSRKLIILGLCLVAASIPTVAAGFGDEAADSAYWSATLHEENSLSGSLLYLPYVFLRIPAGIISGISNPKPSTWATMPPQPQVAPPWAVRR